MTGRSRAAAPILLFIILAYAFISAADRAARKPFWYDEVLTVAVSSPASPLPIITALQKGVDLSPPLYHVVQRIAARAPVDEHIAQRLPSILALCLTSAALFVFVGTGSGSGAALIAALMPLLMQLFSVYAVEARPYSLATCAIAWSLVFWQRSEGSKTRLAGCAGLWALAVGLHYYSVFALTPFAVSEVFRTIRRRQARIAVWLAIVAGASPLAVFWPVIAQGRAAYGANFWADSPVTGFLRAWDNFLTTGGWWGAAFVLVLVVVLASESINARPPSAQQGSRAPLPIDELALIGCFLLLPAIGYLTLALANAGVTHRYFLSSSLGIVAATAHLVSRNRRLLVYTGSVLCLAFLIREGEYWMYRGPRVLREPYPQIAALQEMLAPRGGTPVVIVASGFEFLPMAYDQLRRTGRSHLMYLTDAPDAVRFSRSDTIEKNLTVVSEVVDIRIVPLRQFLPGRDGRDVFVYSVGGRWDWLPRRLIERGSRLELVASSPGGDARLYRVAWRMKDVEN